MTHILTTGDLYISESGLTTLEIVGPSLHDIEGEASIIVRELGGDDFALEEGEHVAHFQVLKGAIPFQSLHQYYVNQISQLFDFEKIKANCLEYLTLPEDQGDEPYGLNFLGTVFTLAPSGKYYQPWACSNVTEYEAKKDEIWNEAMAEVFEAHGLYITGGEGDPCDIFAGKSFSWEEAAAHFNLPITGLDEDEIEQMVREFKS